MFSKITNYFHILKTKIVVAHAVYAVYNVYGLKRFCGRLKSNTWFLIRHPFACLKSGFPHKITSKDVKDIYVNLEEVYGLFYRYFFKQYTANRKTPLADYAYVEITCPQLGTYFSRLIGAAWLCEKLGINVKFTFPDTYITGSSNFFENPVLNYAKTCHPENFTQLKKPLVDLDYREKIYPSPWELFGRLKTSGAYGYKIISRLSIRQEIQQQADQWCDANIKGECVGIHYRQTDAIQERKTISIDSYIDYLKQVLDDHYQIFACSDNVQFIDAMHKAFLGRVVSRDITRSKDGRSLHRHEPYAGHQQRQDALIDILILAKVKMIYTVGSTFIDIIRFFNPLIKIIDLSGRGATWYKKIPNYIPVPRIDIVQKAQADTAWKELLPFDKWVDHVEKEKK